MAKTSSGFIPPTIRQTPESHHLNKRKVNKASLVTLLPEVSQASLLLWMPILFFSTSFTQKHLYIAEPTFSRTKYFPYSSLSPSLVIQSIDPFQMLMPNVITIVTPLLNNQYSQITTFSYHQGPHNATIHPILDPLVTCCLWANRQIRQLR